MKKIFILLGCILLSFSLLAKKDTTQVSKKCNLYYSNCERFSHWSLYAKAGLSVFDGDAKQNYNSIIPQHAERLSLGGAVEYSFNPRWGLVADYMYLPIGADESNIKFHTEVHSPALYVSSNLSNLFYSKRKNRHWSVYANLGFALSLYKTTLERTSNPGLYIAGYVPATPTDLPYVVDDNLSFAFLFGLNVECNLNRHLALGLYTQYRMQTKDNFEGGRQWQGNTNDGILAVTLGLRYKISAGKKCHIRNIDMATYNGDKKNGG